MIRQQEKERERERKVGLCTQDSSNSHQTSKSDGRSSGYSASTRAADYVRTIADQNIEIKRKEEDCDPLDYNYGGQQKNLYSIIKNSILQGVGRISVRCFTVIGRYLTARAGMWNAES